MIARILSALCITVVVACSSPGSSELTPSSAASNRATPHSDPNTICVYAIDPKTGALTQVKGSPFGAGSIPRAVAVDPSGGFAYVANLGSNSIAAYTIDATTGAPTEVTGSPFKVDGTYPNGVAIDRTGKFAVVSAERHGVFVYVINQKTGALAPAFEGGCDWCEGVAVDASVSRSPFDWFIYESHGQKINSLSAYAITPTSPLLEPIKGSPFQAGEHPEGVAVDPNGKFVLAANTFSRNVSVYAVDAKSGVLTEVKGSPFAAGMRPSRVAIDPTGEFAYVVNEGCVYFNNRCRRDDDSVSAYRIGRGAQDYGVLHAVAGSPFGAGDTPEGVAVDPNGKFVYVTNLRSNNVFAYVINERSGALTAVAGSPFAAVFAPNSVAIDPRGKFAYVVGGCPWIFRCS